ncbi:hypothetical protein [Candidatus Viridilinea mediisalina]|uniref:Uncharacterized protein n=1 Tax=Candidatus Viridilinea mediisalina TaxID=2024553 RepID=A0A2A6RGC5_9CHLR|nr:hypothetical protein [Candidatus Viridilinea mediisalina]PDW01910.1 hypothetical protein CJ255_16745 [Candidatus Viridilinea mediisalina]
MRVPEIYHRYPRFTTNLIAWLPALLLVVALGNLGVHILRGLWDIFGRDPSLLEPEFPLSGLVTLIDGQPRPQATNIYELAPTLLGPFLWTGVALLLALYLRNALPAIRSSHVGLLVEFAGSWLPLRWEELRLLRVTQDRAGERFIILAEAQPGKLTNWHRLYGLIYGLRWQPGFLISSQISQFEQLVETILTQSERTARALDGVDPVQLREDLRSPFFQLLLGPAALVAGTQPKAQAPTATTTTSNTSELPAGPVAAHYPPKFNLVLQSVTTLLSLALLVSYLSYWVRFLALSVPALRSFWPFSSVANNANYAQLLHAYPDQAVPFWGVEAGLPAPWWLLVAAHLMLLLGLPLLFWVRSLLPSLEARDEGMFIRGSLGDRGRLVPWSQVTDLKATEINEQSQVVLLQSPRMPVAARLSGLLYDGSNTPGVLIASQINNFEPLLGEALHQLAPLEETEGQPPILQQEARSWLLWLMLDRGAAIHALVNEARATMESQTFELKRALHSAIPLILIALMPALLFAVTSLLAASPPSLWLLVAVLFLWFFALLEWPLFSQLSMLLDQKSDGGYEGARAYYLYPLSQLPRLLPLLVALLLQIIGVPLLPILLWIGATVWAFMLTSALCKELYGWEGNQLLLGGLLPVVWQLLLLIVYLVLGM